MKKFMILAACAASFYACSSNDVNTPEIDENTTGLLSVSTSVLTQNSKGTKTIGTGATKADSVATGPVMAEGLANGAKIGVFVFNNNNNFEGYTGATNTTVSALNQKWTAGNTPAYTKENSAFTLGIQPARVYAYFPYKEPISTNATTNHPELNVTPGYTDYLYGQSPNVNSTNNAAKITLNHALAMISFTFTKGANYPDEACQVNAITINNLPASGTMSVVNGIAAGTISKTTTTLKVSRFHNNAYAPAINAPEWTEWTTTNTECNFKNRQIGGVTPDNNGTVTTAPLFHALVLPTTEQPTATAVIRIDNVNYDITLKLKQGEVTTGGTTWEANKHYTYNLKISGTSGQGNVLEVSTVTVRQWTAGGSSDIEI